MKRCLKPNLPCVGSGIYRQITSLLGLVEVWVSKLGAAVTRPDTMSMSDWLNLEKALLNWQSLIETLLQNFCTQPEDIIDETNPDTTYVSELTEVCISCSLWW